MGGVALLGAMTNLTGKILQRKQSVFSEINAKTRLFDQVLLVA